MSTESNNQVSQNNGEHKTPTLEEVMSDMSPNLEAKFFVELSNNQGAIAARIRMEEGLFGIQKCIDDLKDATSAMQVVDWAALAYLANDLRIATQESNNGLDDYDDIAIEIATDLKANAAAAEEHKVC